jgi:hypothetical protein
MIKLDADVIGLGISQPPMASIDVTRRIQSIDRMTCTYTIAVQCCAEDHAKINRFFAKEENGVKLFFLKNYSGKVTHHSNSTQRSPTYTENNDPT